MKVAFCNFHQQLNAGDFMFRHSDTSIGDDLLRPFLELKQQAYLAGITVATVDVIPVADADAVVFVDMPSRDNPQYCQALSLKKHLYLLDLESRLVNPANGDRLRHEPFRKIFTYDDSLVDGNRYIKINYSYQFPPVISNNPLPGRQFCVLIAGNKRSAHPLALYDERLAAIRWFERNHPREFDLFGIGWDEYIFPEVKFIKGFNHFHTLRRVLAPSYPSWKGPVRRKRDVLGQYRFALCYENIRDIPGYITEKIFDAFFAGCIPVYRGAPNVADHIPAAAFVNAAEFPSFECLYRFLRQMDDSVCEAYRLAAGQFLASAAAGRFSCQYFARTIVEGLSR